MANAQRPFDPSLLNAFATEAIKPLIGIGAVVWRYTILVPLEETAAGQSPKQIATDDDLDNLETTLTAHFSGLTVLPESVGYGLRAGQMEINRHMPFAVYASATTPSDQYFQRLRKELEEALVQETILVERQEVWLH